MLRALGWCCFLVGCNASDNSSCPLPASLDLVKSAVPDAYYVIGDEQTVPSRYYLFAKLDYEAAPDTLVIDLRDLGSEAREVALGGNEASYATCHACVLAYTDFDESSGPIGDPYFAISGSLRISTLSPELIAGSVVDVELQHVMLDMSGATLPHADGCSATIQQLSFAAVPQRREE